MVLTSPRHLYRIYLKRRMCFMYPAEEFSQPRLFDYDAPIHAYSSKLLEMAHGKFWRPQTLNGLHLETV